MSTPFWRTAQSLRPYPRRVSLNLFSCLLLTAQPITRLECKSSTAARYNQPSLCPYVAYIYNPFLIGVIGCKVTIQQVGSNDEIMGCSTLPARELPQHHPNWMQSDLHLSDFGFYGAKRLHLTFPRVCVKSGRIL